MQFGNDYIIGELGRTQEESKMQCSIFIGPSLITALHALKRLPRINIVIIIIIIIRLSFSLLVRRSAQNSCRH